MLRNNNTNTRRTYISFRRAILHAAEFSLHTHIHAHKYKGARAQRITLHLIFNYNEMQQPHIVAAAARGVTQACHKHIKYEQTYYMWHGGCGRPLLLPNTRISYVVQCTVMRACVSSAAADTSAGFVLQATARFSCAQACGKCCGKMIKF